MPLARAAASSAFHSWLVIRRLMMVLMPRRFRLWMPDESGIQSLKRLGIKTIINLRMTNQLWKAEEAAARASGILYTNLPMKGLGRPTDEQVAQALSLIGTLPSPV